MNFRWGLSHRWERLIGPASRKDKALWRLAYAIPVGRAAGIALFWLRGVVASKCGVALIAGNREKKCRQPVPGRAAPPCAAMGGFSDSWSFSICSVRVGKAISAP